MRKVIFYPFLLLTLFCACNSRRDRGNNGVKKEEHFAANWDSLAKYIETPEWFKDAKFGIYAHWGVLSVPAYANDWYPRNMHIKGSDEYKHQVNTYGPLSEFGYHDFVPMFKAENFDPVEWAKLFKQSGAKFAGVVAEHHDGWSNWDSDINPWNSMDMGPHRDIVGELETAVHSEGMKFLASFHKARNLQVFQKDTANWQNDVSYFPYDPGMPTSSTDSLLRIMYGNISKKQFYKNWLGELKEVVHQYGPDIIYFDSQLTKIPDSVKVQFVADYFNYAIDHDKQVVITHKEGELPEEVSISDYEKGRMNKKTENFWLTDETISVGSWSYTNDLGLKTANEIIDLLADIVSKNGALLLNVSPRADGVIPVNQKEILNEIGNWLQTNGEAIYGTRTWEIFGEGPTKQEKSGMFVDKYEYTAQDVRYTQKGNSIYAIVLGWPGENKEVVLKSFSKEKLGNEIPAVNSVSILGFNGEVVYRMDEQGLHFTTPDKPVDQNAFVVKISTEK
ncbi:MAG: alpha-L-fucosidase [Salegentibacter sp.]